MSDNPWMNQPDDIGPYPEEHEMSTTDSLSNFIRFVDGRHELGAGALAERVATQWLPGLLAEAERRGAERGWDEGYQAGAGDEVSAYWSPGSSSDTPNPYRKVAQQ